MKKTTLALITLALIASMLFSCSSTQQESSAPESTAAESSVAESGDNETSTSESSGTDKANPEFPDGYPEEFTHGKYRFKRMQGDLYSVYGKTEDEKYALWLWNSRTALPELFSSENAAYVRPDADYCINKEVVVIDKCHFFSTYGEYFGNYFTSNPIDNLSCGGRLAQYGFIAQTGEKRVGFRMECGKLIVEDIPDEVTKITLYDSAAGKDCVVEAVYREPVSGTRGSLSGRYYFRMGDKKFEGDEKMISGYTIHEASRYIKYDERSLSFKSHLLFVANGEFVSFKQESELMSVDKCPFFIAGYYDKEKGEYFNGIYNFKCELIASGKSDEMIVFSPVAYVYENSDIYGVVVSDYRLLVIGKDDNARNALLSDYVGKEAVKPKD